MSDLQWRRILVAAVLLCFATMMVTLGSLLRYQYRNNLLIWIYVSAIFAFNATATTYWIYHARRRWVPFVMIPSSVILGSLMAMLFRERLLILFATLLSLQVPFCWLVTFSLGFPRWRFGSNDVIARGRVSIYGMMSLTLVLAVTMSVLKHGDFDGIPPSGVAVLLISATVGWLLGCATFSFHFRWHRLTMTLLLAVFCAAIWVFLRLVDIGQSNGDSIHISVTMPLVGFVVTAAFGTLLFFVQRCDKIEFEDSLVFLRRASTQRSGA